MARRERHYGTPTLGLLAGLGFFAWLVAWLTNPELGEPSRWTGTFLVAGGILLGASLTGFLLQRRAHRQLTATADALSDLAAGRTPRELPWVEGGPTGRIAASLYELGARSESHLSQELAAQERWRAVLQGMAEGVVVLDADGRVELLNPRARDLFRIWGDVAGRSPLEVIRRTEIDQAFSEAAQSAEPVICEVELTREGETHRIQMHASRFPKVGTRLGTVAVFHDLTEIRRLETLRKEFVGNVSHELKTPLTAIRGFAETLQQPDLSHEDRERFTGVILRHSGRLSELIDDLLELSRIEGGRQSIASSEVDLRELVRAQVHDLKPRLDAAELECQLEIDPDVLAFADRRAVERVLLNLIDNAIKYSEPGGRIRIGVRPEGDMLHVSVEDQGMGIPADDLTRIFERFYRVDKARTRDLGGTGLGLSIVKHLVQGMNGQVDVESQEGSGTTFRFTLPSAELHPHNVTSS